MASPLSNRSFIYDEPDEEEPDYDDVILIDDEPEASE
jgi:hypothetical protein